MKSYYSILGSTVFSLRVFGVKGLGIWAHAEAFLEQNCSAALSLQGLQVGVQCEIGRDGDVRFKNPEIRDCWEHT